MYVFASIVIWMNYVWHKSYIPKKIDRGRRKTKEMKEEKERWRDDQTAEDDQG